MARARFVVARPRLQLSMSLPEAAALEVLLRKIVEDPSTPLGNVSLQLHGVWDALFDHQHELEDYQTPCVVELIDGPDIGEEPGDAHLAPSEE